MPASSFTNTIAALTQDEQLELKKLALQVITQAIAQDRFVLPKPPKLKTLQQVAANFVTLYTGEKLSDDKQEKGELRGCIGCFSTEQPLWKSVCQHAYSSAFEDYRFTALQKTELTTLRIEISILSELEPIENNGEQALQATLVPDVDGLLLKERTLYGVKRSAIFLPSVWHSLKSAESFVLALKQKGGWSSDYWCENIELFRFHTQVF